MSLVRVLEIGGTHVTAATVDADEHRVRERTRTALDSGASAAGILASLSGAAMSLADTVPTRWAVAIPDPFDYTRGIGLFRDVGKFDALYGVDVGRALRDAITPPPKSITFMHDTEAFLLGEWLAGAAVGARRCAAVTLGTGVGSAFLDNGTIVRDGLGIPPNGRIHRLSIGGAPLEDTVSRRAIRARYAARVASGGRFPPAVAAIDDEIATTAGGKAGTGGAGTDLDVREIAELAEHGDAVANAVLEHAFCALGRALAPMMREFAPDVLVIGGSIAHSWDLLIRPLTAGLAEAGVNDADIRPALNEADSAVIGAARHAMGNTRHRSATPTREAILQRLARPDLVERLAAYYAPDSTTCGTNFLDGTETQAPDVITAADLFAVTSLGHVLPASVARTLLHDTAEHAAIAACLDRLPPTVTPADATDADSQNMRALHDAVLGATGDADLAAALCARKRPELFAPLDRRTKAALHLPAEEQECLRALLRDPDVRAGLERAFGAVRGGGTATDVHPLRQICVVAELSDVHP